MLRKASALVFCLLLAGGNCLVGQSAAPHSSAANTATQNSSIRPAPVGFVLEDSTPVKLRLTRNLSSATDRKGDQVDFEVVEDVLVDNILVIPHGSTAWATITEAEHKKSMGRGGKLDVNIDSVRLKDGEKVPLRAVKDGRGGGHVGAMTGAMVATGIVFFPAAPLFLFIHGKDLNIPKGTEVTAYVAGNIPLDKSKFEQNNQPQASGAKSTDSIIQTVLSISSTPAGADVEVDGSFIGNTPSSFNVAPGEHSIKIAKKGYKSWERKLKATGGAVNLSAQLEQGND